MARTLSIFRSYDATHSLQETDKSPYIASALPASMNGQVCERKHTQGENWVSTISFIFYGGHTGESVP